MSEFPFERLRRRPDVEAANLFAVDASDRLILDEAAPALASAGPGEVVVLEDHYGALTLAVAAQLGERAGIRVHQDALSGEHALDQNAADLAAALPELAGLPGGYRQLPLGAELVQGARVVLMQLPRSLAALDELAGTIARFAAADVTVVAGGRIKHMSMAMNEVLRRHFGELTVSPARQKSRVLVATQPLRPGAESSGAESSGAESSGAESSATESSAAESSAAESNGAESSGAESSAAGWPRSVVHADLGLTVSAHGAAFAGTTIDIGTRFLLDFVDRMKPDASTAIDLGCGTGVLAAALALRRPGLTVLASDQSAAAVASAAATMRANGVSDRVRVFRDDALGAQPDASAELIVLNPPFHIGASVHAGIALKLFEDAARVLRPGGELWTVWNTHLGYRSALTRIVGPTHQVGRNSKFTVTVSTRR